MAREGWRQYLEDTPRNPEAPLIINDILDGSFLEDENDPDSKRIWHEDGGINVLGSPLGSPAFIESYLFGNGINHRKLMSFI